VITDYPDCDLTRPFVPPRSRLYALEPMGMGTPLVEGLASYVMRLAAAHQVTRTTLITQEIVPHLPTPLPVGGRRGHWHTYRAALSGFSEETARWVAVLTTLTGRPELVQLTLLPWRAVLPPATQRRRAHAWCPACYAAWYETQVPLYTPLLWQIAEVRRCPQHGAPLTEQCPGCGKRQPTLSWRKRTGYCAHCRAELWRGNEPAERNDNGEWEVWVAAQVGALVSAPPPASPPTRRHVMDVMQAVRPKEAAQDADWLVNQVDCRTATLAQWRMGRTVPSLYQWLRLAALVGRSLREVLSEPQPATPAPGTAPVLPAPRPPAHRTREKAEIQAYLAALLEHPPTPPPSLRAVARQLGEHYAVVQRWFPELCRAISQRYLEYRRTLRE
jgi:hypothetical protein